MLQHFHEDYLSPTVKFVLALNNLLFEFVCGLQRRFKLGLSKLNLLFCLFRFLIKSFDIYFVLRLNFAI